MKLSSIDQDTFLLVVIAILAGGEGAILGAAALFGFADGGGPLTAGISGWLYDYQSLLGGSAALIAAVLAVVGQIWLHHKAIRDKQVDGANSFILELTTRAVALATRLREARSAAEARDGYLTVKLNSLQREIDRSEKLLETSPALFVGPSHSVLAGNRWRLAALEASLNSCREAVEILQSEFTGGHLSFSDYSILDEVASDLSKISTDPLPPFIGGPK